MNKLNVLLTTFNNCNRTHYQSLALGYLKAYALKDKQLAENANLEIVDFCIDCNNKEQVLFYLTGAKPDVIGFSCYCWNAGRVADLCRLLKIVLPETKLVLGGPEVGPIAGEFLRENPAVDVIVRGEGEIVFSELLTHYLTGQGSLNDIGGLTFMSKDKVVNVPDRPLLENLDEIPSPYLTGVLQPRDGVTYLETYRGCPHRCKYCYEGKNYSKLRFFSDDRVEQEIQLVTKSIKSFSFIDSVFNLTSKRTSKLAGMLQKANQPGAGLHTIEVMAERVDSNTAFALKAAGVVSVEAGPQSAVKEVLEAIDRPFDAEKFASGVKILREVGIHVLCDLIIGLPKDDFFKLARSVKYVSSISPSKMVFSTLHVLPGTSLFEDASDVGLVFDKKPPHLVLETPSFKYREIRKAEIMAMSLAKEFNVD